MSFLEALYPGKPVVDPGELSLSSTSSSSSGSSEESQDGRPVSPVGLMRVAPLPMVSSENDGPSNQSEDGECNKGVCLDEGSTLSTREKDPPRLVTSYHGDDFQDVQRGVRMNGVASTKKEGTRSPKALFGGRDSNNNSDSSNEDLTAMVRTIPNPPLPRRRSRDKRRISSRTRRSGGKSEMTSSSLTHSLLLDDYENSRSPLAVRRRSSQRELSGESFGSASGRRSSSQQYLSANMTPSHSSMNLRTSDSFTDQRSTSPEISSESSPDSSPSRAGDRTQKLHQHQQPESQYQLNSMSRTSLTSTSLYSSIGSNSSNDASTNSFGSFSLPGSGSPSLFPKLVKKMSSKSCFLAGTFFCMVILSVAGTLFLTNHAGPMDDIYKVEHSINRPDVYPSAAGLRGKMVLGRWDDATSPNSANTNVKPRPKKTKANDRPDKNAGSAGSLESNKKKNESNKKKNHQQVKPPKNDTSSGTSNTSVDALSESAVPTAPLSQHPYLQIRLPPPLSMPIPYNYDRVDPNMYGSRAKKVKQSKLRTPPPRIIMLDPSATRTPRKIKPYPADFTDNTQLYGILPSDDERLSKMEIRAPYSQGECVPMQDWQTTFHPWCNGMHELPLHHLGSDTDGELTAGNDVDHSKRSNPYATYLGRLNAFLFGTKGFWRYAWRVDIDHVDNEKRLATDTIVLKTLKFEHNFEDAHFEHDRVDAVAMERLTSSPHVIKVFGFCGHSVLTEYADGSSVGELADKARKRPLERLRIARDIANGLADVHGIDGDGNATFVHLDVNPANVVSVGGTLKLNDFNIGIIRRWNTTSNEPCGFPAQYPNPQWRSPEEARNEQNLTEKVDIFSMGHIFFRLICGHEPWNRFEPGGKPSKEEINRKVQRGIMPFIPEDVRNSDIPEVIAIRDAMISCYALDPKDRPSAREIAQTLDKALTELSQSTGLPENSDSAKTKKSRRRQ